MNTLFNGFYVQKPFIFIKKAGHFLGYIHNIHLKQQDVSCKKSKKNSIV